MIEPLFKCTTISYPLSRFQVQRTISLTSENPSEAFFSADEDLHTSRSSSLRTTTDRIPAIPKKRFASDLRYKCTFAFQNTLFFAGRTNFGNIFFLYSIGAQTGLDGKLSSHRSDYEIHSPDHRSIPKRPQSTAELVSLLQLNATIALYSIEKRNKPKTFFKQNKVTHSKHF